MNLTTKGLAISLTILILLAGFGLASAQSTTPESAMRVRTVTAPPRQPSQLPEQPPEPARQIPRAPSSQSQDATSNPSPDASPLLFVLSALDFIGREAYRGMLWIASYMNLNPDSFTGRPSNTNNAAADAKERFTWDHDPITVSIRLDSTADPSAVDLVKAAISDWQTSIRGRAGLANIPAPSVPFGIVIVGPSSQADIVINLKDRVDLSLGYTKTYSMFGKVDHAEIMLPTKNGGGLPLDKADIQNIAAHEFGHAMGLSHSTSFSDVMYPDYSVLGTSSVIHPTSCDLDRLVSMYYKDGFGLPNVSTNLGTFTCK